MILMIWRKPNNQTYSMCGICGFVNYRDDKLLSRMTQILGHRGPDSGGFFISSSVSFGHRRLSIIDLSNKGKQPMFNEDKTVVIVFNGEIFNFQELREKLIKSGHKFKSKTDTETVVHCYEQYGIEKTVSQLRGFFAFVLWDSKRKTIFLVRDRIGVKPLYYFQEGKKLFFASEIKAILECEEIKKTVNERAYKQYLVFQASLGEETMFEGIKKVLPATITAFKEGKLVKTKYWELKKNDEINDLGEKEKAERFKDLLLESVETRLISDVPLGVLLSGGLDSSSIVALMSELGKKQIKTFSVGFGEPDDELKYARLVANRYKTDHIEIIIKPKEIQKVLTEIVWHQDEPLADGGGIATYLTAAEVNKHVKVVLVGEGGDEFFGGYSWYKLGLPELDILPEEIKKRIYFYLTTFSRQGLYPDFKKMFDKNRVDFLSKMMKFEIENILPNSLCMKVDKMTSAFGLEAREPFLDHKLGEFCFSLSAKDKVRLNSGKVLFRKVMKNKLPEEILKRKKHGFLLPTQRWLNGELNDFTKEMLFARSSFVCKMFSRKELENLFIQKKYFNEIERINLLWRLFIFELWYNMYFIKKN